MAKAITTVIGSEVEIKQCNEDYSGSIVVTLLMTTDKVVKPSTIEKQHLIYDRNGNAVGEVKEATSNFFAPDLTGTSSKVELQFTPDTQLVNVLLGELTFPRWMGIVII